MFAHVLVKLGLSPDASEADAVTAIDALQRKAASSESDVARFVALSGKKTPAEAHGTFEAWRGQGDELVASRAETARLTKNNENAEAKALIDEAQQARKVVPATRAKAEAIYINYGLPALKAHVEALVPVAPSAEVREQRVKDQTPGPVSVDGKRYEDMTPAERHNLRASGELGERMYQELRTDWLKRDKPRGNPKAA